MNLRLTCFLLLFFTCQMLMAQNTKLWQEVKKADSLIFYFELEKAEKHINDLYPVVEKLRKSKRNVNTKLQLMFHKANIHIIRQEFPEALKLILAILDESTRHNLHEINYLCELQLALIHEIRLELLLCKKHLDKAYKTFKKHELKNLYSTYCVRASSYYRFSNQKDSAVYFARQAMDYAQKNNHHRDLTDAYLLLGILLSPDDYRGAINFFSQAAHLAKSRNDIECVAFMYHNIARNYMELRNTDSAFIYNDSAFYVSQNASTSGKSALFLQKHTLYDSIGNKDSAYYYFRKYHYALTDEIEKKEASETRKVIEQYENDKKENIIKTRTLLLLLIIIIALVIAVSAASLFFKNQKINEQNLLIQQQVEELRKLLDQKQVLLSELQHRVKNNLQQIISILDLQKESIEYNNIEEVIRENQNRIQSMALLHKKLNIYQDINSVNFDEYITELIDLTEESYHNSNKNISIVTQSHLGVINIEKALSLGMIIQELLSNSIKHAFPERSHGNINISILMNSTQSGYILSYTDDGIGFNFKPVNEKGSGVEIIKGFIKQLNGRFETNNKSGFEITIYFQLVPRS